MQIRIEGSDPPGRQCAGRGDFPGYENVHVGVQRRNRRDYFTRRSKDGLSKREISRCLKRYIARQACHAILADLAQRPHTSKPESKMHST